MSPPPGLAGKDRRRCLNACNTCKRRKERCNGVKPCQRCIRRRVQDECSFSAQTIVNTGPEVEATTGGDAQSPGGRSPRIRWRRRRSNTTSSGAGADGRAQLSSGLGEASFSPSSRLIELADGSSTFLGDSSPSALLHCTRQFARIFVGNCTFSAQVSDPTKSPPLRHQPSFFGPDGQKPPPKPDAAGAEYLVQWYLYSTQCLLDLFDETELFRDLAAWLSIKQQNRDWLSATFYLVLAVGAQTCPQDKDQLAEQYYDYGCHLVSHSAAAHTGASLSGIRSYALMTMYLMGLSQIEAAYTVCGQAIRAAYTLGLHRGDLATDFSLSEARSRRSLWKFIRVFDCFFSTVLGRPLSTSQFNQSSIHSNYSATIEVCIILESVLKEASAKPGLRAEVLQQIIHHKQRWTAEFPRGIQTDGLKSCEIFQDGHQRRLNTGLLHIKQAYYGAVILFTRRFLIENLSNRVSNPAPVPMSDMNIQETAPDPMSPQILGNSCIYSAIRSVEVLQAFLTGGQAPKRLPFVVNSIFYDALVLGLAVFGDLHYSFPLEETLKTACKILYTLGQHDWLATQYFEIVTHLAAACKTYINEKSQTMVNKWKNAFGKIFGDLDCDEERQPDLPFSNRNLTPERKQQLHLHAETLGLDSTTGSGSIEQSDTPDFWSDGNNVSASTSTSTSTLNSLHYSADFDAQFGGYAQVESTDYPFQTTIPNLFDLTDLDM